jgi:tyrosine-specific transport protein
MDPKSHPFWNAVFLVAGITIGASELGLPVALRHAGYFPAVCGMLGVYLCMFASGILLTRLFIRERRRDLPSLFQTYLGRPGAILFNVSYFSLAFCLLVAYWSGLKGIFDTLNFGLVVVVIGVVLFYCLRKNFKLLYQFNSIFTIGLIVCFILLIMASLGPSHASFFQFSDWMQLSQSLPLILCSFGYHQVIPMVCRQLDYDRQKINGALLIGTFIPLAFNLIILTVGFRLFSPEELSEAARLGVPVFVLLSEHFQSNLFLYIGQGFSFFAIITSLLGVSMAMHGALRDIFKDWKFLKQLVEILILIPLPIAMLKPQLFFVVLGIAGGIFGNLMAGLLPVTPFLLGKRFRFRYFILWLAFLAIFILECINLCFA